MFQPVVVRCDREVEILHAVYLSIIILLVTIIVVISVIHCRMRRTPGEFAFTIRLLKWKQTNKTSKFVCSSNLITFFSILNGKQIFAWWRPLEWNWVIRQASLILVTLAYIGIICYITILISWVHIKLNLICTKQGIKNSLVPNWNVWNRFNHVIEKANKSHSLGCCKIWIQLVWNWSINVCSTYTYKWSKYFCKCFFLSFFLSSVVLCEK